MSARENATTAGISMGSALAMVLSFSVNHSILWAIIHGVCSWFYVIYRAIRGYWGLRWPQVIGSLAVPCTSGTVVSKIYDA